MPAILLWNIEHSSGYQDTFSAKNRFINEVVRMCIDVYDVTAVVLTEVTSKGFIDQLQYNTKFHLNTFGEGSTLKYAVLTKHLSKCTDVTAYFPSFRDKPRGVLHVRSESGSGMPPLLVTHIKSDLGRSGVECLTDICQQMPESMQPDSAKWPSSGLIALADWNLKAEEALAVTRIYGGRIVAPDEPTRYPSIRVKKILEPTEKAKTLDYACVFGDLRTSSSLQAFVPNLSRLDSIQSLVGTYLRELEAHISSLDSEIANNIATLNAAMLAGNFTNVGIGALAGKQSGLNQSKTAFEVAAGEIRELHEHISSRKRLDAAQRQAFRQIIAQAGLGPDHMPVVIRW